MNLTKKSWLITTVFLPCRNLVRKIKYEVITLEHAIYNTFYYTFSNHDFILTTWYNQKSKNWGDALNPVIINLLTGKKVIHYRRFFNFMKKDKYSVIGSILGEFNTNNLVIWGSGFISEDSKLKKKPKHICAVRGPLSRDLIMNQNLNCPEIYGDPALLYPLFYKPQYEKKYKIGIIPHYIDQQNDLLNKYSTYDSVKIIDVFSNINSFIDDICQCQIIASSSLHGLIASDTYGIPSIWIEFSNKVIGNGFKFHDYFASVNRNVLSPIIITENTTVDDILNNYETYHISIDIKKLIESCPFLNYAQKEALNEKIKGTWMESGENILKT